MGLEAKNPYENDDFRSDDTAQPAWLLTEIDHVAIAVHDLDEAIDEHRETFGVWVDHREVLEADAVEVALLKVAESYVHLMAPTSDDSLLARFLAERGPGLHHVGYRVDDCAAALAAMIAAGHEVVDHEPRRGVRGSTTAFIHPHTMFGTLVQLVEE
ncbi:MAG TPA: methylmalonyl-CoA epimerase [Aquihabitans sp.]|jgi:methylmalonyl-CoA epimerase|nr:methylmalonyl-CoA epimerase [Aquihabitans sp.]